MGATFLTLSGFQVLAICVITCGAIALAYVLGLDEGRVRGRRSERQRALEAAEKVRQQIREEQWFPARRHRP